MTSQRGQRTITIHILPNISRSNCNHSTIFGQIIEYYKINIFLQKSCRKGGRKISSRPLLFYRKALCEVKASGLQLIVSIYFDKPQLGVQWKQTALDYWSRNMLDFGFLEKGLSIVSPPHFVYIIFWEKCFSCYILLTDQISLPNCLYFLRYWSMCVLQLFVN